LNGHIFPFRAAHRHIFPALSAAAIMAEHYSQATSSSVHHSHSMQHRRTFASVKGPSKLRQASVQYYFLFSFI
jgi:hypothetical protein